MITVFNRKELMSTFSMKEQAEIRDALSANNIDYSIKTVNWTSSSPFASQRARQATLGENLSVEYEYIFYVKKEDFDQAKAVVNKTFGK